MWKRLWHRSNSLWTNRNIPRFEANATDWIVCFWYLSGGAFDILHSIDVTRIVAIFHVLVNTIRFFFSYVSANVQSKGIRFLCEIQLHLWDFVQQRNVIDITSIVLLSDLSPVENILCVCLLANSIHTQHIRPPQVKNKLLFICIIKKNQWKELCAVLWLLQ